MSEPFETRTIEESLGTLIDYRGKTPPKTESGVRLVTAKVIKDGYVQDDKKEFIAAEFYDEWMRRGLPKQWDIVITTEAPLGEVAQLRTAEKVALAQRVILLRTNPNVYDQSFFFQALKGDYVQGGLKARGTGTTVLGIKQSELRKVKVPWFPLPTQRKIASILSAYDDLIENNTHRIAILEEMAQAIYREWFVNFRFPGHENVKLVDSPLGQIPEGWEVIDFKDECQIVNGFAFKSNDYADHGTLIIRTKDFSSSGYVNVADPIYLPDELLEKYRKFSLQEHDFLLIMVGASIGRFGIVFRKDIPALQNQNMWAIRPKPNSCFSRCYVIQAMSDLIDRVTNFATGAAREFYRKGFFYDQKVTRPSRNVLASFDDTVAPITDLIGSLLEKNNNLRTTRDLLLPKLISGQLDVEDLDIDVGEPLEELAEATA